MTDTVLDFLKTAKNPTLMIIGVAAIVCLGGLLFWVETSRKDIKFWGIEINVPESDAIKACRAIQAAFHEKMLGLESERQATYRRMENHQASIDAFTKLQLDAKARDQHPDTQGSDNEQTVIWHINNLIGDLNSQEKFLDWVRQTERYDTERVNKECGLLLRSESG
jgi:hypothetical protein